MDSTAEDDRLDHDPAATSFPKMPVVSRGAETDRARVEAARLVFTFAEGEFERGHQAGAREALLAAGRALRNAGPLETQHVLDVVKDERRTVRAVLIALDDIAGQGGERS